MKKYLCRVLKSSTNLEKTFTRSEDALVWAGRWAVQGDAVMGIAYEAGQGLAAYRAGDKYQVRSYKRNPADNQTATLDTLQQVQTAIQNNIEAGVEGYDVLSLEQPVGSANTLLLVHEPPRLMSYYQGEEALHQVFTLTGGTHGRVDELTPPDDALSAEEVTNRQDIDLVSPDLLDALMAWLTVYNSKVPAGNRVTSAELKAAFLARRQ